VLLIFTKIIAVYDEKHMTHVTVRCGKTVGLSSAESDVTRSYHIDLKVNWRLVVGKLNDKELNIEKYTVAFLRLQYFA
jgi:hypothetical protein